MAKNALRRSRGKSTTTNYGWVKPTVGASVDAWGGYINADLDGIDATVHRPRFLFSPMRLTQRQSRPSGYQYGDGKLRRW